eukprot:TRINITY_DN4541_c0_g2_i4.p1 TRINITY_DN4541_c0_g2~~TRINITY_DN4541_c0_g2_i4.p1  ORF type:complete len:381 (+),score=72.85 TRINITY_DN4541_c0_g2_i4:719-1861(+)
MKYCIELIILILITTTHCSTTLPPFSHFIVWSEDPSHAEIEINQPSTQNIVIKSSGSQIGIGGFGVCDLLPFQSSSGIESITLYYGLKQPNSNFGKLITTSPVLKVFVNYNPTTNHNSTEIIQFLKVLGISNITPSDFSYLPLNFSTPSNNHLLIQDFHFPKTSTQYLEIQKASHFDWSPLFRSALLPEIQIEANIDVIEYRFNLVSLEGESWNNNLLFSQIFTVNTGQGEVSFTSSQSLEKEAFTLIKPEKSVETSTPFEFDIRRSLLSQGMHRELKTEVSLFLPKVKNPAECSVMLVEYLSSSIFVDQYQLEDLERFSGEHPIIFRDIDLEKPQNLSPSIVLPLILPPVLCVDTTASIYSYLVIWFFLIKTNCVDTKS